MHLRYMDCVPEIIDKIYGRMDFLEPDPSTSSANELMANNSVDQENILLRLTKTRREKKQRDGGVEYEKKLKRAQLKRERSRRFAHFASRTPDLNRLWAPKTVAYPKKSQPERQSQKPDEIKATNKIRDFLGGEALRRNIEFNISESEAEDENDEDDIVKPKCEYPEKDRDDKLKPKCESPRKASASIFRNFMVDGGGGGGKAADDGLTALRERVQSASQIKKNEH